MPLEKLEATNSLTSILEDGKTRVTRKVNRLEANLKAAKAQLKAINDLLTSGSTPAQPRTMKD